MLTSTATHKWKTKETINANPGNCYVVRKELFFICNENFNFIFKICYNYFLKNPLKLKFAVSKLHVFWIFLKHCGSSLYRHCVIVFVKNLNRCTKNEVFQKELLMGRYIQKSVDLFKFLKIL